MVRDCLTCSLLRVTSAIRLHPKGRGASRQPRVKVPSRVAGNHAGIHPSDFSSISCPSPGFHRSVGLPEAGKRVTVASPLRVHVELWSRVRTQVGCGQRGRVHPNRLAPTRMDRAQDPPTVRLPECCDCAPPPRADALTSRPSSSRTAATRPSRQHRTVKAQGTGPTGGHQLA